MKEIKGSTVLVVDDNPRNLLTLFSYLRETGLRVLVAQSGESALEQITYERPDIILLDILMPGIDGFETCRRLKANETTQDISVIFMTALNELQHRINGFELGAVDYITKPFYQEELLARVNTHLLLQRQRRKLHELNAMKDRVFSILAQDMKSVLTPLISLSDLLVMSVESGLNAHIHEVAKTMNISVQHAQKLLENLVHWASVQDGTMAFEPCEVNLHSVVLENVHLFRGHAKQKQIDLAYSIDQNIQIYADKNMISLVLRNLLSNAVRFTRSGGTITVSANVSEDSVEVAVSDTGIGISTENIQKLFRIDEEYREKGTAGEQGIGLGLILCKDLIEKNGGKIWVQSEVEKGTIFFFLLPKANLE